MELVVLGQVKNYDIYTNVDKYLAGEKETARVIMPTHSLVYLNVDQFRSKMHQLCPLSQPTEDEPTCKYVKLFFNFLI